MNIQADMLTDEENKRLYLTTFNVSEKEFQNSLECKKHFKEWIQTDVEAIIDYETRRIDGILLQLSHFIQRQYQKNATF